MTRAFTLATCMPPTKGHLHLAQFTSQLGDERAKVIVTTQPHEPFTYQRYRAMRNATYLASNGVDVEWLHRPLPQDPETPGFWEMWKHIMIDEYGFKPGDIFVSSELYGAKLAEICDGIFMPYDPDRELYYTKATRIREDLSGYFHDILPEFQHNLMTKITVFGAESTGKTTLSKELSYALEGHWFFEYARPYLESIGTEISVDSMTAIWKGQMALQKSTQWFFDKAYVIQDTDLFSTVGYWEQPHWAETLGKVPQELVEDAIKNKSDLYIITKSNIPFEEDPLRYGGDRRESSDEYWIGIAEKYDLNYVVLDSDSLYVRMGESIRLAKDELAKKASLIEFDRGGY